MNLNPADEIKEEQGLVIFNPVRSLKCICMMYLLQYVPNNQLSNVCGDALYEERVRIDVEKSCSEPEIQMSDEFTYAVENYEPNIKLSDVYDAAFYERRARIEDNKSCSEPEVHMSDEFNSTVEQYEPNIQLSNVYSDAFYEGRLSIDVDKSCSEPEAHMTSEFNPADVYDITLNEGGVKIDNDKLCSKLEVHTSDELNSAIEQEKSFQKSMHLKQSAVKKNISNKNESSDEFEWPSSDSSDEGKKSPLDSSDEWKIPPRASSDEWEMRSSHSSDRSETFTSPSNDSCDSSNSSDKNEVAAKKKKYPQSKVKELSEYEKKIEKNRDEKLAFLQSLRMNEVKEDLNEAIMSLKPPRKPRNKDIWPKDPTRKSVRLTNVHFDFSEKTLERQAFYGIEEETEENNTVKRRKKSAGKYKKFTKSKSYQVQDESESSDDLEKLSNTSNDDNDVSECSHENEVKGDLNEVIRNPIAGSSNRGAETTTRRSRRLAKVNIDLSEEAFLARSLAAVRKEFKENKMKRKSAPDKSKKM